ncbi:MAG: hypothetical protein ABIU11_00675, partial [Chitinophagaceae bacterium]
MKKYSIFSFKRSLILLTAIFMGIAVFSQSNSKDRKIVSDSKVAKAKFISTDGLMKNLFASAHGYVIFPNIGKGGLGIGGAAGNGAVYEKGILIGMAKMKQLTIGFQWGGQAYREVIFFESQADINRFKENKFEFSAQASAVAVTAGASG